MSADTNADRLARGELPVNDDDSCPFCGAGADSLVRTSDTHGVAQHSHQGTRDTTIRCEECESSVTDRERVQSRVNLPSRPRRIAVIFQIPEDYCMAYCTECGATPRPLELCEDNVPVFEGIFDGEKRCSRCGGTLDIMEHRLVREGPGGDPGPNAEVRGE